MTRSAKIRHRLCTAITCGLLLPAAVATADSPAALAPRSDGAEASFQRFADGWMERVRDRSERSRARPTVRPGAVAPVVTWRGVGEDFEIELQPTGRPMAPYVGVLRYTELVYHCEDMQATRCRVATTQPVTEIFRMRDGGWSY